MINLFVTSLNFCNFNNESSPSPTRKLQKLQNNLEFDGLMQNIQVYDSNPFTPDLISSYFCCCYEDDNDKQSEYNKLFNSVYNDAGDYLKVMEEINAIRNNMYKLFNQRIDCAVNLNKEPHNRGTIVNLNQIKDDMNQILKNKQIVINKLKSSKQKLINTYNNYVEFLEQTKIFYSNNNIKLNQIKI